MSPEVPYPFLSVLKNDRLDIYYDNWKHKMLQTVNINTLLEQYCIGSEIADTLETNHDLENTINRGLKDFSMLAYVSHNRNSKWLFLPENINIGEVLMNLDLRAIPFCPYDLPLNGTQEKYIFIKDITPDYINTINRHFQFIPRTISDCDPYSITLINTTRYNLSE